MRYNFLTLKMLTRRVQRFNPIRLVIVSLVCLLAYLTYNNLKDTNFLSILLEQQKGLAYNSKAAPDSFVPSYDVKYLADKKPNRRYFATVVTTLFHFSKSKHPDTSYEKWLDNMLASVTIPIVAFVDPNWAEKFTMKCNKLNLTGVVFIAKSVWNLMRDLELERSMNYIKAYQEQQSALDPEKEIHSPELYAIWNLKHHLVAKVTHLNPYDSDLFIYTDSGAWRTRAFKDWPDQKFVRNLKRNLKDRILYGQIGQPDLSNFSPPQNVIEGGFFVGSKIAIRKAYENFYNLHDEWFNSGKFVGKDQPIMSELAFVRKKSDIVRLRTFNLKCTIYFDPWFFYQYYLAQANDYICSEGRLLLLLSFDDSNKLKNRQ